MIAWKPYPFIFIHIPKCAGTSIEEALIPIATSRQTFAELPEVERTRHCLPGKKGLQHAKLRYYAEHFKLSDFFKFAVVRNPWDRAISQINYLRTVARSALFRDKSFKEQIRAYCSTRRDVWRHDLGACQVDYLLGKSGKIEVDFIGRFESLTVDFQKACRAIGISPVPALPHVFDSKRAEHYSLHYDDESVGWIRQRFARDIEVIGYEFENRRGESCAAVEKATATAGQPALGQDVLNTVVATTDSASVKCVGL
jgi:hypothetical protein